MKRNCFAVCLCAVALFLLGSLLGAFAEGGVLTLPANLQVIDEEAFYKSSSLERVVLPEGVTEIRSRAFADSSLTEINLPDSITFIADDAFGGSALARVNVQPYTYAYSWAEEHG